ncbi:MAG: hypothetical protein K8R25_15590 [Methanosarcinales archaeon]|nr:hypothetical protein [Methanosarcinales archaeon]
MIEIRTTDITKLDQILNLSDIYNLKIGLGSESCVYKLPTLDQIRKIANTIEHLSVITPITPQKHYEEMLKFIKALPSSIRLVVNDMGILYSLHNSNSTNNFYQIAAGRGIVHTSEACPWVEHLLRDESDIIKEAFLKTNLNYTRTFDLITGLGISAIETDMESNTVKAAVALGLPTAAHLEFIAVAYARSCHTSRFYNEKPPDCTSRCNTLIKLQLADMFDLSGTPPGFAQPDQKMKEIFPTLYLLGNIIFMKSKCREFQGLERIIVNADMYEPEKLPQIIETLTKKSKQSQY